MYDELIKRLRASCESCKLWDGYKCCLKDECSAQKSLQAADAIEELSKRLNCVTEERDAAMKRLCEWCGVGCSIENRRTELCEIACVGLEFLEPPEAET